VGRGGIAPTHSRPRHKMGVSGQHHAPAMLLPLGKGPPVPIGQEAGWAPEPVWTRGTKLKLPVLLFHQQQCKKYSALLQLSAMPWGGGGGLMVNFKIF
jgi:hypothetical protein